jgi:hypothetical protein
MFACLSGKHNWIDSSDARKCCNPQYIRALHTGVFGPCFHLFYRHYWLRTTEENSMATSDQVAQWIESVIALAKKTDWFTLVDEQSVRSDLADWAADDMFSSEREVRNRLCQYCDGLIRQFGRPNFRCQL